jgi:uncharacterized protein with FMN-binding domain
MDSEQEHYRDLFHTLEKESVTKAAKRSGKVANRVVGAGCAAVIAVYGAGYARTQSAAERFSKQLAVRRLATLPLPGVQVTLDRHDVSHPRIEASNLPSSERPSPVIEAKHKATRTAAPGPDPVGPDKTDSAVASAAIPAPPDVTPPAPAAPVFAPPPIIEHPADTPPPLKPADPTPAGAPAAKWKDGDYTGWGYSRHGDIEAKVIVENGRIVSAIISQCRTRYSCSVIEQLPPEIAARQSPEVDFVSGATQSADAFYDAVVEALGKAK